MSSTVLPPRLQTGQLAPFLTVARRRQKESWVELGWPGRDPLTPCLDVFDFDHSGSVVAPGGTDPIGRRFDEVRRAIRLVHAWTFSSRHKVAIVHFDQPSIGNSGVVALNGRKVLPRLASSLLIPLDAVGGSDLLPSLEAAEQLSAQHPDHQVRFTILSDFALTDGNLEGVFERLAAFPGQVHAVVLNSTPPALLTGENLTITTVSHEDPPGTLAAAVHRSLTATRRGRRLSVLHTNHTDPSSP